MTCWINFLLPIVKTNIATLEISFSLEDWKRTHIWASLSLYYDWYNNHFYFAPLHVGDFLESKIKEMLIFVHSCTSKEKSDWNFQGKIFRESKYNEIHLQLGVLFWRKCWVKGHTPEQKTRKCGNLSHKGVGSYSHTKTPVPWE